MRLPVLLIAFVSATVAQGENTERRSARTPQGQIKYSDPNGLKVNWRFFAPQNQWRSHLENTQRSQRRESETDYPREQQPVQETAYPREQQSVQETAHPRQQQQEHPPAQQIAQPQPNQQQYKPYSALPNHIKQLLQENYQQQRPYVDQSAFLYDTNFASPGQYDQQPATAEHSHYERQQPSDRYPSAEEQKYQSRRDYDDGRSRGRIEYKDEYDQQEQQQQQQQQYQQQQQQYQQQHEQQEPVSIETMPVQPLPKLVLDKNMPSEIQQLLQFQAQIPYDVIANRIIYKPKALFIPKPLPDDVKGPHYYRSKIYYVKNDEVEPEYETSKPVEEEPRH